MTNNLTDSLAHLEAKGMSKVWETALKQMEVSG